MTGLSNILEEITQEAEKTASVILQNANDKSSEIIKAAKEEASNSAKEIEKHGTQACKNIKDRGISSAQLHKRQSLLNEKQKIISSVLDKAHNSLLDCPVENYFEYILKMVQKYSTDSDGEIIFNKRDKERLPQDFENRLAQAATGGKLTISTETRDIDGGFVLSYGGIEENCSFKAMFEGNQEELQDKVHCLLFS